MKIVNGLESTRQNIFSLVRRYFRLFEAQKVVRGIPLIDCPYGSEEVCEALDSLLSTRVTMGAKVRRFEEEFASYLGVKRAVMVNSGSSANLVALSVLASPLVKNPIKPGDEVIVPAVTWSTSIWPIINVGAVPVLVDVEMDGYNLDPAEVRKAITRKTKAIVPVHLLGNPCDMGAVKSIAREHGLHIMEDTCEAHGAELKGKKAGTLGDLGTFSFFFSHHITTVEGGMLVTNNEPYAEIAKSLRAHGWIRELKNEQALRKRYRQIDPRFLFIHSGFNFRPTEVQGAFGLQQMKRLEEFIEIRRSNAAFWTEELRRFSRRLALPRERPGTRHVSFAYALMVKRGAPFTKDQLADFLERKGIETRQIEGGNMAEQPGLKLFKHRRVGSLKNARFILRNGFFLGNHQGIGDQQREYLVRCIHQFMRSI
ncbi:MAG: DegT/DnrJ/EryC1/StrS family aminotransferase [Acidobacteria bacterium]|nr:DegT/DnrJ/EryC1/StrS family aminotransferase [Acidobacteriota bacterium]